MKLFISSFFLFFFIHFAFVSISYGEYRVYLLKIENTETGQIREPSSTLDPSQYIGYYPLKKNEFLTLSDTWMCYGRTDYFQPLCKKPTTNPSQN